MKRIIVSLLLVLMMLIPVAVPQSVYADPPEVVKWTNFSCHNGLQKAGIYLNTASLKVEKVWCENNYMWDRVFVAYENTNQEEWDLVFSVVSLAYSGYQETDVSDANFKFMRTGPNDPDGEVPDHIQMMPNTYMSYTYYE